MTSFAPKIVTFSKGQLIFREGAVRNVAYLVKQGAVTIFRTVNNRKVVLARLGEGELFGEMAIINKDLRTASAMAAEYCTLVVLDEGLVESLLAQSPQTVRHMVRQLTARLRDADRRIQAGESRCGFMTVCRTLHFLHTIEALRQGQKAEPRVDHAELCQAVKDLAQLSQAEIETVLDKLTGLGLVVRLEEKKTRRSKAFVHTSLTLPRPEEFLATAAAVPGEVNLPERLLDMEYLDLGDFAAEARATPQAVYAKMARGEIPEDLFFLHRERALAWLHQAGHRVLDQTRRRKAPEDLETVDDILEVDNATLEEVFRRLGYFRTQAAYALAGEAAREKILHVVGKKVGQTILDEGLLASDLTPIQAEDLEQDLLEAIRVAKRLEKKDSRGKRHSGG